MQPVGGEGKGSLLSEIHLKSGEQDRTEESIPATRIVCVRSETARTVLGCPQTRENAGVSKTELRGLSNIIQGPDNELQNTPHCTASPFYLSPGVHPTYQQHKVPLMGLSVVVSCNDL